MENGKMQDNGNNGQRSGKVEGGEKRNGRLSPFKNAKQSESEYNEQYVSGEDGEALT